MSCSCATEFVDFAFCGVCGALHTRELVSPFDLFGLPTKFDVDMNHLESAYLALQNRLHPDRFLEKSADRETAERYSSYINTSYLTLKHPVKRAEFLLNDTKTETHLEDLSKHLSYREHLECLNSLEDFVAFEQTIFVEQKTALDFMRTCFESENNNEAKRALSNVLYSSKLLEEVRRNIQERTPSSPSLQETSSC